MRRLLHASARRAHTIRRFVLAGLLLAGLACATGAPSRAGEEPTAAPEVWTFRKGEAREAVRTVDVTGLDDVVREALLARMAADGYHRLAPPAPGQDLGADARALVAHGGRFPRAGAADPETEAGSRDPHGAGAELPPGAHGILLGAPVRLESLGEVAWLRVLGAPDGSLARGLGLVRGDRILALDGRVPTLPRLVRLRAVEQAPGQLALRVQRRESRTEDWTLTFARGPAPAHR